MKMCTFWEERISRQCKLTYRKGHDQPLHSEWQFIATGHVLHHYVLFFDSRSQQRPACACYESRYDFCIPSSVDYSYSEVGA